ncbi:MULTISPECIES: hypothetical protein [Halomicrobium]|uniref:Zinc ribbon domain-containing protein n=2 Tax=Halomicrobium mukohataei TaxID=57705 RepID=C7P4Q3_HALMD|nr:MULTISPECIES: hypothetical protein [Halomicrobium]ACV48075.1 conserved hypothetical protein [Halomicrobium mukohataei DSM 12286]QCD66506.1 hypothetical protein E5139_12925 [Halomicrobium mukohataei]QFR21312.1 hypothetical protein GBQ70_12940 [Halomicrobium sp. ZPS1]
MEWRCTWCGKPHEENDPPCDNCGHNTFERAVEQVPTAETDGTTDPVWVCTECGRQHTKNSPPCKRCGNVDLEQRQPDWDDLDELGGTSYRDVLEPRYVAGYAIAAVLGITLVLAYAGVVTLPGMGRPPVPDDVAGEGDRVGDRSIAAVEAAYVEQLNERRDAAGVGPLTNDTDLEWYTAYVNKRTVQSVAGDGRQLRQEERNSVFDYCDDPVTERYIAAETTVDAFDSDASLAEALLDSWDGNDEALTATQESIGVDVHVGPDGRVFVTVAVC